MDLPTMLLGKRPNAFAFGITYGLVLEVVIVNVIVRQVQAVDTLYAPTSEWSWWVAQCLLAATFGLVASMLLRRRRAVPGAPRRSVA